jgi:nicotinate-nucleotide pyrophosphorylase (carboxylating)
MMSGDLTGIAVGEIVARALAEDIGPGDVTTLATVDVGTPCKGRILAKAEGVLAGLSVAEATFHAVDSETAFEYAGHDGSRVRPGATVARLDGDAHAILTAERTALNFIQRMSGIATLTAQYVAAVKGTAAQICDTRKTAPGLRVLDKYAVRMGGGRNHRAGLFDGLLIKDNHIRAAGGLTAAIEEARERSHHLLKMEVEAQSLIEVEQTLDSGADVIMLDNMDVAQISEAVRLVRGRCELEVSGGVTLETVRALAECGVDYISVGALTHSAPALDFSLELTDG